MARPCRIYTVRYVHVHRTMTVWRVMTRQTAPNLYFTRRNDDTAHVTKDTLKRSPQFPQFLTVKIKWSKNVREERDCPNQIILA